MTRVLFVCLGNICRSPLAEGLFQKKINTLGMATGFRIDSAGTSAYHIGQLPDLRTRQNALRNGLELVSRARQFSVSDFYEFDMIVAMDRSNLDNIIRMAPLSEEKLARVMLMRDFDPEARGEDVPDPYDGGEEGFQQVYDILDRSTEALLEAILSEQALSILN